MTAPTFQAPEIEHLAELLPQYHIDSFIAQGGMGAVYKGQQRSLERDVAIKVLPRELGEDPEFRESFSTEAKAMARLNHPNLIGVYDHGDIDGMPFIVMEYVDGCSLHDSAWNQVVEPAQAVAIVKGICDGLTHAHDHGIVHRDIKPANILLTLKAEPKIADFGLAHAADSDQPGLVMGTPGYTAPEVFNDPDSAGPLADIYSVGVILHQLLTSIDPTGSQTPPTQPTGNIRLDAIWRKATHINPTQRYQTATEMAKDLNVWSNTKPGTPIANASAKGFTAIPSTAHPRPVAPVSSGAGMTPITKVFVIAILAVVVVFTYQLLQETKDDIKKTITKNKVPESNPQTAEREPDPASLPVPEVTTTDANTTPEPESSGIPEPADITEPEESEPYQIARREEPEPESGMKSDTEPKTEATPEPDTKPEDLTPGDPELRTRAVGLIEDARKKRGEAFAKNAKNLAFQFGVQARRAEGRSESKQAKLIREIEKQMPDDRLPEFGHIESFPDEVRKLIEHAQSKEETILSDYQQSLTTIRDAYVTRLKNAANETSEEDLEKRLIAQAERAEDLNMWIAALSPEPNIEKKQLGGMFVSSSFIGSWKREMKNGIKDWIAHPDGRLEVVGEKHEGKWEMREDGTVTIDMNKPKLFYLNPTDEGWEGTSPYGNDLTLTPAN